MKYVQIVRNWQMQPEFAVSLAEYSKPGLVGSSKPRTDDMDVPALKTRRQQRKVRMVSLPWNNRTAPSFKMDFFLLYTGTEEDVMQRTGRLPASFIR